MRLLLEETSSRLVDEDLALAAARRAFGTSGSGVTFPVVIGHSADPGNRFTIKSGAFDGAAGVKIGSFWPGNSDRGLPRHSSTIVLLDETTGRLAAVVEAAAANAYRTAAADALAVSVLARPDAEVLTVVGTGHQALYEARAVVRVRPIRQVLVAGRDLGRAGVLAEAVAGQTGVESRAVDVETGCGSADVLVTATTARSPLFEAAWIRPGTHVSAMGADARGKQELPPELLAHARLFCDLPEQSRAIGEFQHAPADAVLVPLGAVLAGTTPGRTSAAEVTVFDSSGFALQDLTLALALLERDEAGSDATARPTVRRSS